MLPFLITLFLSSTIVDTIPNPKVIINTSLHVGGDSSFVSLNPKFRRYSEPYDSSSAYSILPMAWVKDKQLSGLRVRHPNSVAGSRPWLNESTQKDFMILPYEYGMAIEYNGVVECWVGEWSIHRGNFYADVEGKGNGWGGVLWVGDDQDEGGIRVTARNNLGSNGDLLYGEISSEKFAGGNHGNLRLRLPDTTNTFQFVYGKRGSNNVVSEIGVNGIVLPSGNLPVNPKPGTIFFDAIDNKFKGFDGTSWKILSQ